MPFTATSKHGGASYNRTSHMGGGVFEFLEFYYEVCEDGSIGSSLGEDCSFNQVLSGVSGPGKVYPRLSG